MDKRPAVLDKELVPDKEPVVHKEHVLVALDRRGVGGWDLNHAPACVVP